MRPRSTGSGRDEIAGLLLFAKERGYHSMHDGASDRPALNGAVYKITLATGLGMRTVQGPVNALPEGFLDVFRRFTAPKLAVTLISSPTT